MEFNAQFRVCDIVAWGRKRAERLEDPLFFAVKREGRNSHSSATRSSCAGLSRDVFLDGNDGCWDDQFVAEADGLGEGEGGGLASSRIPRCRPGMKLHAQDVRRAAAMRRSRPMLGMTPTALRFWIAQRRRRKEAHGFKIASLFLARPSVVSLSLDAE